MRPRSLVANRHNVCMATKQQVWASIPTCRKKIFNSIAAVAFKRGKCAIKAKGLQKACQYTDCAIISWRNRIAADQVPQKIEGDWHFSLAIGR